MTCTIHNHAQRSPEWYAARAGVFSASEFAPFYIEATTATAKKARENHILEKIFEPLPCDEWETKQREKERRDMDHNYAVQRGIELEPFALEEYEKFAKNTVANVGFCINDYGGFGCSPDGLCDAYGFESKSHWRKAHGYFLRHKEEFELYHRFQVHGSMAVTGLREWHLWGWNPGLAPILRVVKWDAFTDRLLDALYGIVDEKNRIQAELCGMWDEWKNASDQLPRP
jgi:hypothetical protein